jgi:hypothetical protein
MDFLEKEEADRKQEHPRRRRGRERQRGNAQESREASVFRHARFSSRLRPHRRPACDPTTRHGCARRRIAPRQEIARAILDWPPAGFLRFQSPRLFFAQEVTTP